MSLLFGFIIIPALIIFIIPRRYFGNLLGWIAIPVVLLAIHLAHPPHWQEQNLSYTMMEGFVFLWVLAISMAIGLRLFIFYVFNFWSRELAKQGSVRAAGNWLPFLDETRVVLCIVLGIIMLGFMPRDNYILGVGGGIVFGAAILWLAPYIFRVFRRTDSGEYEVTNDVERRPSLQTTVQLIIGGMLASVVAALVLRSALQGLSPAWLVHGGASALVAAFWVLPKVLPKAPPVRYMGVVFESFRWSFAVVIAGFTATILLVAQSAEAIAGEQPHCISVADHRNLTRDARTLFDLSGLTMKGISQNALLFVGEGERPRVYHWSYRERTFVQRSAYSLRYRTCIPEQGFVRRLPIMFAERQS